MREDDVCGLPSKSTRERSIGDGTASNGGSPTDKSGGLSKKHVQREPTMRDKTNEGIHQIAEIDRDDFALARVPASERYSWLSIAVQRFGQLSALSQFLLGATLGFAMDFWSAFWALTLGAVVLEVVAILTSTSGALGTIVLIAATLKINELTSEAQIPMQPF